MTYQQEKKIKDAEKAKRSKVYRYQPVPFDRINPPAGRAINPGELVVKVQPHGCPKNGTMGMCYIGNKNTGEFIGMVCVNSLVPAKRKE